MAVGDLLAELAEARRVEDVVAALSRAAIPLGAVSAAFGRRREGRLIWASTAPPSWRARYTAELVDADPGFRLDLPPPPPLALSFADGFPGRPRDMAANALYEEARGYGLTGAILTPDLSPAGRAGRAAINMLTDAPTASLRRWMAREGPLLRLMADAALSRLRALPASAPEAGAGDLTPREREALTLLAEGLRAARIAERMGVSQKTAELHIARARARLGARTREQALAIAFRRGLIG